MCVLSPELELQLRTALKNKILEDDSAFVFERRRLIKNKQDFFLQLGKVPDAKLEIRFTQIDFLGFTDILDEGLDDCPPTKLNYKLHCFFQFVDVRNDNSNSTDDFIKYILDLRCRINTTENFIISGQKYGVITLQQTADIITDNDILTDVTGHYAEFLVSLEVR